MVVFAQPEVEVAPRIEPRYRLAQKAFEATEKLVDLRELLAGVGEEVVDVQLGVALAQERQLVLQVGHIERFNPVFSYLETAAPEPRFIECHRLSPYPARSTDIGVVLDLMIHDLDVVLAFVRSPVVSVDAVGIPVLSASADIANRFYCCVCHGLMPCKFISNSVNRYNVLGFTIGWLQFFT